MSATIHATASPDMLCLGRSAPDRALPLLVAAILFLAALAGAAGVAVAGAARQWRSGAQQSVTVQVPGPDTPAYGHTRAEAAAAILGPDARRLPDAEVADLIRPWLGAETDRLAFALPAIFVLPGALPREAEARLQQAAPGSAVTTDSLWQARIAAIAGSLLACSRLAMALFALIAVGLVAVTARASLAARRETIEIVHGLGGTDGQIAHRFARYLATQALLGGLLGAALATPILLGLARLAAPLAPSSAYTNLPASLPALLPPPVWIMLFALPLLAAAIGWLSAQLTVRSWLARLP